MLLQAPIIYTYIYMYNLIIQCPSGNTVYISYAILLGLIPDSVQKAPWSSNINIMIYNDSSL